MKGVLKSLALIALITAVTAAVPAFAQDDAQGGLRYSITVSKFENRSGWHGQWDIGHAWGTVLTDMLNQTGRFIVLGETDMRGAALDEQDFAASGRTAGGKKAPATGQMTPAQLLVKGAITHVQGDTGGAGGGVRIKGFRVGGKGGKGEVNATIYIVDSTTGQVVASQSVVGTHKRKGMNVGYATGDWGAAFGGHKNDNVGLAVQDACAEAVEFLLAQLPNIQWTGSVVLVKDGKVYVNRGAREGISVGQKFAVGEVEVLRDPDTGEVLDESMTELAQLEVNQVKEKLSICSVVSGKSSAVAKGQTIHLR
ncbi:MAG: CsgG/HfaB family protein [Holophagae bacterium]|jgi:curli biogenesis system outer membrane secretion channel CsgG